MKSGNYSGFSVLKKSIAGFVCLLGLFVTTLFVEADMPQLIAKAKSAVVMITTFTEDGTAAGLATGFFYKSNWVVTNAHVVRDAFYFSILGLDGHTYVFQELVALDRQTDIAILALDPHAISSDQYSLPLAPPYQAKEGQHVLVIGNPEGLYGTVSDGMISAIRSDPPRLQITAPISPGSSGSPVLNDDGEVLGVVKRYDSDGQNLNFPSRSEDIVRAAMAGPPGALEQYRSDIHNFSKQARQPQPTPTVSDRDADAEVYSQIVTLIDNYMRHTENGRPISLTAYCTTVLTVWYGEKNLSIAQAERSIADYYRKWPVQDTWYDIKQISVSHWSEPDWYDVELPFSWSASNKRETKSGKSRLRALVCLTSNGVGYRIAAVMNVPLK